MSSPSLTATDPRSVPAPPPTPVPVPARRIPVNKWLVTISISVRHADGRDRLVDRERRAAAHPRRRRRHASRRSPGSAPATSIATGAGDAADRLPRPAVRAEARLPGLPRAVPRRLVAVRHGATLPALVVFRVIQGLGAGALQPTEQAILRQTFPPEGAGHGDGAVRHGGHARARPSARRSAATSSTTTTGRGSSSSTCRSACSASSWCAQLRARSPRTPRARTARCAEQQRKNLDWAGIALMAIGLAALQYFLEEGSRDDWFDSRHDHRHVPGGGLLAGGVRHPRADRAVPGGRPAPVQGPGVPLGHAHRRPDVRAC